MAPPRGAAEPLAAPTLRAMPPLLSAMLQGIESPTESKPSENARPSSRSAHDERVVLRSRRGSYVLEATPEDDVTVGNRRRGGDGPLGRELREYRTRFGVEGLERRVFSEEADTVCHRDATVYGARHLPSPYGVERQRLERVEYRRRSHRSRFAAGLGARRTV